MFSEPAGRERGIGAEVNQKEGRCVSLCVFQLQLASFVTQLEMTVSLQRKSSFAGETEFDQSLWLPTSDNHQVQFYPKTNGWSSRRSGCGVLENLLTNPRLVQIFKLDRSVSAVWPMPSCDLNTGE